MARLLLLAALFAATSAFADVAASMRYRSPKNADRRIRKSTDLIVLHTTEAPAKSSLRHLSDRGECHYCVTEDGSVYSIVDRHRVAFHAGRSMWNGREDVDDFSVGIECVGYHDKAMPREQLRAISSLVKELQRMYSIPDSSVVTHSQVAYGDVNRWQKRRHRGRKRCGMLFAMPSVRRVLGLSSRPAFDPDVRAKRLAVGDAYLEKVLYGGVDTMVSVYGGASSPRPAAAPSAGRAASPLAAAPRPAALPAGRAGSPLPAAPAAAPSTAPQSIDELKRRGFAKIGSVTKQTLPARIAGAAWNAPDTYYTIRNKVIPGDRLDQKHVEVGMDVWRRK